MSEKVCTQPWRLPYPAQPCCLAATLELISHLLYNPSGLCQVGLSSWNNEYLKQPVLNGILRPGGNKYMPSLR